MNDMIDMESVEVVQLRPHCLSLSNCVAAKPTTHCRRCTAARLNADPALCAKRRARLKETFSDPKVRQQFGERLKEGNRRWSATPEGRAKRRANAQLMQKKSMEPEGRAKFLATRAAAAAKRTETVLGWCPPEWRDAYRVLVRKNNVKASDARRMIEEDIELKRRKAAAEVARHTRAMQERHERDLASRY